MGNMGLCINYLTLECWLKKRHKWNYFPICLSQCAAYSHLIFPELLKLRYIFQKWAETRFFFCSPWKLQMVHEISSLHASVGGSCGGIFFPPSARRGWGGVIKKECWQYYFWDRVDVIAVSSVMGNHCVLDCSKWLLRANSVQCLIWGREETKSLIAPPGIN